MKGSSFYLVIYVSLLMLMGVTPFITISENYKAAWIYKILPIDGYSNIYKGSSKALIINYLIPPLLITSLLFIYVFGISIIPHVGAVILNLILFTMYKFKVSKKDFPFSRDYRILKEKSKEIFMHSLIFTIISVTIHFFISKINYSIYIYLIIQLVAIKALWNKVYSNVN